jgi:hypothetical protein
MALRGLPRFLPVVGLLDARDDGASFLGVFLVLVLGLGVMPAVELSSSAWTSLPNMLDSDPSTGSGSVLILLVFSDFCIGVPALFLPLGMGVPLLALLGRPRLLGVVILAVIVVSPSSSVKPRSGTTVV